jgi:MFS family permease
MNLGKLGRKITLALLAAQSLFSASLIMVFTVGSIIAVQLAGGNTQWTGVPSTLVLVGAAMMAYPMGRLMDRIGRRWGLTIGNLIGVLGALAAGWAVVQGSLGQFLVGVFMMGLARGAIDLGRYAAAEANPARKRARAVSLVVLGGTVGSIFGPILIKWTTGLAASAGLPGLSGPWFAAAGFLALSMLVLMLFLRPDPLWIGRQLIAAEPGPTLLNLPGRRFIEILRSDRRARLAITALVTGQLTMVLVMTITPVHMDHHQHDLGAISWVIMAHTLGMFGLSYGVGWLVDRLGRINMIVVGGIILMASCVLAPVSNEVFWLALALFLLGLGWNCCFVAGSTLLADTLRPHEKGRIQGLADVTVNMASGVGSLGGGLIFAAIGYTAMNWIGLVVALVPILLVILWRSWQQRMVEGAV